MKLLNTSLFWKINWILNQKRYLAVRFGFFQFVIPFTETDLRLSQKPNFFYFKKFNFDCVTQKRFPDFWVENTADNKLEILVDDLKQILFSSLFKIRFEI